MKPSFIVHGLFHILFLSFLGGKDKQKIPKQSGNALGFMIYFTIHSNSPAELSLGSTTSSRRALVFTGSKLTVHAAPLSVGYPSAPVTGFHLP
jgi:hypothetical protein